MITREKTEKSILKRLFDGRIHARCYKCNKYLVFFEVYNGHCSGCGNLDFNKIELIDLYDEEEDDDIEEEEEKL